MHVTDLRKKYFIDPRLMAYFAALTVITGLAFVFFSSFSCSVNQDRLIEENKQLSEIASMTAGYVRERVNLQMLFTRTAANQIKVLGGPNEPAAAVILREAVKEGGFESMSIIFPDGHMITTGGEKFNFLKFGNRPNERIVCKNIDGIDYIIFLVPVMINGKAAAQVQGVVKASALDNLVDQKIYGGDGQIQLLRSDGSYILSGGLWNSTGDTGNFFDFIQSVRLNNEINLEEIINRFNSRSELSFGYTYEGLPRLAYFSPLGLEDWYIGVSIKGKTIGSETAEVRKNASMLLLQMGMIFALLIIYIIYMERRSARNISRTGRMTEGLIANVQGGVLKCRMDDRFTYQYLSGSFAEMAGCDSPEEAIKIYDKSFWNSIVTEDIEKTRSSIMGQLNDKGSFEVICRIVRKDGGEICAICKGERVREYDGSYSIYSVMLDITHTQRAIEELRVNEERYRIATEQANIFVFEYDPLTDTIHNSEKMSVKFNVEPVMKNITEYFEILSKDPKESEHAEAFIGILNQVRGGAKNAEASYYRYAAEGSLIYTKTHVTGVFDSEGNLIKAIGIIKDITEQNDTKIKYLKSKKYGNILSSLYDHSYEFDATNDRVTEGMEYITDILGLSLEGPFSPLARIFADRCVHPEDRQLFLTFNSCEGAAELFERKETELDFEFRSLDSDKKGKEDYTWNSAHMSIYIDPSDSTLRARIFVRDITESASASEMLKNKAERDSLTSLYNRSKTEELINKTLEEDTVADKTRINALLLIDLDNFKKVNDMMGHLFGDAMLTEVTKILKKTFRSSDIMGRIGGDEFVVFMKDIPNMDIAVKKAKEANKALKFIHKGIADSFSLSISIGIAFSPADGTTFSDLCGRADIALYCSKDTGKGCCNIYNADGMGTEFGRGSTNLPYDEPRRINDETFEENPPKHIFRILYGAKNMDIAIKLVMELIVRHYNFSRAYIFENTPDGQGCSEIYEWCNDGVEPHIHMLQNCRYGKELRNYQDDFDSRGIYSTIGSNPGLFEHQKNFKGQQIAGSIKIALMDDGAYRGFIGFDCMDESIMLPLQDIDNVSMSGQVIAAFLIRELLAQKLDAKINTFKAALNDMNFCSLIIDADTHEILFANKEALSLFPEIKPGTKCHHALFKTNSPCGVCIIKNYICDRSADYKISLPGMGTSFECKVIPVEWTKHRNTYMLRFSEISKS